MKKEFKAPIVEAKELAVLNSVMDDVLILSANQKNSGLTLFEDSEIANNFNIWKGFKN